SQVVLALGNSTGAASPPRWERPGPVRDAWQPDALAGLAGSDRPVVLVGTGLTAVDVVISLEQAGFTGPIHAVSRRGLLPRAHVPLSGPAGVGNPPVWAPRTARELLAALRAEVRRAGRQGGDWRDVVDGLRPVTQELWASLPEDERERLHRHALRYWEVHRHRMAPAIAGRIAALQASGGLRIAAGRILSVAEHRSGAEVIVRPRQGRGATGPIRIDAAAVIRCTGPREQLGEVGDPVLDSLFAVGDARPGPLGLGLAVDADGRLLDRHGRPSDVLWAIGPLRRGALLETTAIPEIRVQASALARMIPAAVAAVEAESEAADALLEA
ncbi:MAG TPA: hydroxyacylglutathione hydrolase, partial [Acidimicrobiia bacterium]|nr:hydroxyacylglutathione hydrolase [Acidimicrobiia bacterium]